VVTKPILSLSSGRILTGHLRYQPRFSASYSTPRTTLTFITSMGRRTSLRLQ
jgi:hypothetical protein